MKTITATHYHYYKFVVPDNVVLLEYEDPKNCNNNIGSWYIRWGTLLYIDTDGVERGIEGEDCGSSKYGEHIEENND